MFVSVARAVVKAVETADLPLDRLTTDTTQELALVTPKGIRLLRDTEVKVTVRVEKALPTAP